MKLISAIAGLALSASAALAAPINPTFFFTAYDQGNNGFGVAASEAYPVATPNDFTINFNVGAILLRGSELAGTTDRKSYGFVLFELPGITSVSNATLNFQNRFDFFLNGPGFPATAPTVGIKSTVESSFGTSQIAALITNAGAASTSFATSAPSTTTYSLDVTGLINAAMAERGTTNQDIVLIFENLEDFASLPNQGNGGYGNIDFTGFSLDAVEGPAPAVPLPAGLPLLLAGLGALTVLKRKSV